MLKPLTVWITTNWKILKELGIPDHLTCLLRNLYTGQEATVRTGWNNGLVQNWERSTVKDVYCQTVYLTYTQSTSCEMLGWMKHTGIKIPGRNINNLRYADDTTLMAESEEELKSLLMRVKKESEKAGLKLCIKKLRSWHLIPSRHGK